MTDILLKIAIIATAWIVGRILLERATAPARALHLTIFTPWRGDGWPSGVQEDDDARFAWRTSGPALDQAPGPACAPRRPDAGSRPASSTSPSAPGAAEIVEIPSGTGGHDGSSATRVGHVKVRGPGGRSHTQ